MNDNKKIGEKPQIEYYKAAGIDMVRIPYEITEVSPSIYSWRELSVKFINFNYGGLVSSLIGLKYSPAEMTAVVNNYLLDPEDEETKVEFAKMQDARKEAKAIAHWIMNEYK
jgi:hypothetical protein